MTKVLDPYRGVLLSLEATGRRVWGNKVALAATAHALGGLGLGLLIGGQRAQRPLGLALVGLSLAAHLYALATMPPSADGVATRTAVSPESSS